MSSSDKHLSHNHADTWPCNRSCPVHPEFVAAPADTRDVWQQAYDEGVAAGRNEMLDSIRASVMAYPNGGGDDVIMKAIELLEMKAQLKGYNEAIAAWRSIYNKREMTKTQ